MDGRRSVQEEANAAVTTKLIDAREETMGIREESPKGEELRQGKQMLGEVAERYAHQHGLQPRKISWEAVTEDQLSLVVETDSQSVAIAFSVDEVEDYPAGTATEYSRKKIRDKFASLSM